MYIFSVVAIKALEYNYLAANLANFEDVKLLP
jgi:hypothetical protein